MASMTFLQRLCLVLGYCVLAQALSPVTNSSDITMSTTKNPMITASFPGSQFDFQVEVETNLDLSELPLEKTNSDISKALKIVNGVLNIGDKITQVSQIELLSKQTKLLKFASGLGNVLSVLNVFGAVASFIFSFLLPSDLEIINKRFDEVNRKLDSISNKLTQMETSIKTSIAFHTFLTTYIQWEYAIRNGAEKLQAIREEMGKTRDERKQMILALDYVTYYNDNQLEASMLNMYRITVTANSATNRNLFDLFIEEHSCDINELSGLMIILKGLMLSAAQQTLTYHYFKGNDALAKSSHERVINYLFEMRQEFEKRVYYCKEHSIENARKEVEKILMDINTPLPDIVVPVISQRLTRLYPWYAWAVAEFKEIDDKTCDSHLERKGSNYFLVQNYGEHQKNIIVAWQDVNEHLSCTDVSHVRTLVPYQRCAKCSDEHVKASEEILTQKRCPDKMKCQLPHYIKRKVWDWLGVHVEAQRDLCSQPMACNGHGGCNLIPHTNQFMCICHPMYEGETCEKEITLNNEILSHLSTLRSEFMAANGIPNVVDIYFELQNVAKGLQATMGNIVDAITHTQSLVKHSEILYETSYIAELYTDLQQGNKSFNTFGELMEEFLAINSEYYILYRLKGILLGEGIGDLEEGDDFFNTFKKNYVSNHNNPCSKMYATDVGNLKKKLLFLDEAIGEALLMYKQWSIDKGDKSVIVSLDAFSEDFRTRQSKYHAYWNRTSCPSLSVPDLVPSYCDKQLSYENMKVSLKCLDHKSPSHKTIECVRRNGQLVWSVTPTCNYQWADWGSWSACSVTCDGGRRSRTRECIGHKASLCGSESRQEETCNTVQCCLPKLGKYQCGNGRCISASSLCDGKDDCGNGEDESKLKCPHYIRNGDTIALKSSCTVDNWLSSERDHCRVRPCPGTEMEDYDWNNCRNEVFVIKAGRRSGDSPIYYGDEIAMYSNKVSLWVSCSPRGGWCDSRPCPGNVDGRNLQNCGFEQFHIFSSARKGVCSLDTYSGCIGKPIQHGDTVFIQANSDRKYWLSDDGKWVRTRPCPGRYLPENCRCEKWRISKRM